MPRLADAPWAMECKIWKTIDVNGIRQLIMGEGINFYIRDELWDGEAMASALGHNVPRIFTLVFAAGTALAGLAGVIGGNYQVTEPAMAFTMGPIVFVVVVFGGLGSLTGCFIASILMGLIQTFAVVFDVSLADLLAKFGFVVTSSTPFAELLTVTLPRVGALLPFLMLVLILVFRPRGLMGTRDT